MPGAKPKVATNTSFLVLHPFSGVDSVKIVGSQLKFENYESVQHGLQFSGIKKGAKISFHRHFNDVRLIPIELIHSKRNSVRKAREAHLIN